MAFSKLLSKGLHLWCSGPADYSFYPVILIDTNLQAVAATIIGKSDIYLPHWCLQGVDNFSRSFLAHLFWAIFVVDCDHVMRLGRCELRLTVVDVSLSSLWRMHGEGRRERAVDQGVQVRQDGT